MIQIDVLKVNVKGHRRMLWASGGKVELNMVATKERKKWGGAESKHRRKLSFPAENRENWIVNEQIFKKISQVVLFYCRIEKNKPHEKETPSQVPKSLDNSVRNSKFQRKKPFEG